MDHLRENNIILKRIALLAATFILAAILVTGCKNDAVKEPEPADIITSQPVITIEDKRTEEESEPGDSDVIGYDPEEFFYAEEISDELFARMQGKSYPEDCTVSRDDLRHLSLLYKDINGETHIGEMVCNVAIADKLTDIFRKLYDADYPIEKIALIDEYNGDDDASMADNNTSCFNYRYVSGTENISRHGYGMAVDLNPRYNPYVHTVDGETVIEPENGQEYANRDADFDYKIDKDDLAYKLFTQAGFTWGGSWTSMKDYQHFQIDKD